MRVGCPATAAAAGTVELPRPPRAHETGCAGLWTASADVRWNGGLHALWLHAVPAVASALPV